MRRSHDVFDAITLRRKHGGRRARVRGSERARRDFPLLAAAINLARLAALGVRIERAASAD